MKERGKIREWRLSLKLLYVIKFVGQNMLENSLSQVVWACREKACRSKYGFWKKIIA